MIESFVITAIGLMGAFAVGFFLLGGWEAAFQSLFLCLVLAILEISLSFDNAVINASVLKRMTPLWQHRFMTWGFATAVVGMRLVFPLAIVALAAKVDPWSALVLAVKQPDEYARIMKTAHIPLSGFGGAFLLMVALKYFFDHEKDVHWIRVIERPLAKLGRLEAAELAVAMVVIYVISTNLPDHEARSFLNSGLWGLVTFIFVDGVSAILKDSGGEVLDDAGNPKRSFNPHRESIGLFMYLEVLDASFSFDGVIGAFALTHNLFLIAIGLSIGAIYVRSLTLLMVRQGTLNQYRYLEAGAFYAIGALATIMFLDTLIEVHEWVTGLIGAGLIVLSFWSSVRHRRKHGTVAD